MRIAKAILIFAAVLYAIYFTLAVLGENPAFGVTLIAFALVTAVIYRRLPQGR